jgi:hypothetical protein
MVFLKTSSFSLFSYISSSNFLFTERPYTKIARPATNSTKNWALQLKRRVSALLARPRTTLTVIISCGIPFKLFSMCALARPFFYVIFFSFTKHTIYHYCL